MDGQCATSEMALAIEERVSGDRAGGRTPEIRSASLHISDSDDRSALYPKSTDSRRICHILDSNVPEHSVQSVNPAHRGIIRGTYVSGPCRREIDGEQPVEAARGRALATGPRGGGPSLEAVVKHVIEAEAGSRGRLETTQGY